MLLVLALICSKGQAAVSLTWLLVVHEKGALFSDISLQLRVKNTLPSRIFIQI